MFPSTRRFVALVYLVIIYVVLNAIVKYIFTSFIIFCVIYTLSDGYKKRRRFMWIFYIVKDNVRLVTYALIGDSLYDTLSLKHPPKRLKPSKEKN